MKLSVPRIAAVAITLALCIAPVAAQSPAPASGAGTPAVPAVTAVPATGTTPAADATAPSGVETGKLAWYGRKFAGRRTASGEHFNPNALTMAHKTLPFGTHVKVTNSKNKKSVTLRVNDRGPMQGDRVGDVSLAAAQRLGMIRAGVIDAELQVVSAPAKK